MKEKAKKVGEWALGSIFPLMAFAIQCGFIVLYATVVQYHPMAKPDTSQKQYEEMEAEGLHQYTYFSDVHVMIFVGFGFLMTFLKKYGFGAVGLNFFLSALAFQWALLVNGFWNCVHSGNWEKIPIGGDSIVEGDFAAASVMISYGAVIGKVGPIQLTLMTMVHLVCYGANKVILERELQIVDIGGSLVIHAFGAYFGLAVSWICSPSKAKKHEDNGSVYHSDLFAMIGTVFLWIMWPSFNSALGVTFPIQMRTIENTVISLCACCVTAFAVSSFFRPHHHFDMVDIQNATLAGGVAVGASACMDLHLVGAMGIGMVAAIVSTLGFIYLQPLLLRFIRLHDTCGVHNLHGMPGVLGGLCAVISSRLAHDSNYGDQLAVVFPGREHGRTAAAQAAIQLGAIGITLASALVSGLITGLILRIPLYPDRPRHKMFFNDEPYWHIPDWDCSATALDAGGEDGEGGDDVEGGRGEGEGGEGGGDDEEESRSVGGGNEVALEERKRDHSGSRDQE